MSRNNNDEFFATYFTTILFQNLIISQIAQLTNAANHWTDWEVCNPSLRPNCYRFRELTCKKQGVKKLGVDCTIMSRDILFEVYEQQLNSDCLAINTGEITNLCRQNTSINLPCRGHCYNGIQEVQYNCTNERKQCTLSNYRRCYNGSNCSGQWSNWASNGNCSKPCGGGRLTERRSCYENGKQRILFQIIL